MQTTELLFQGLIKYYCIALLFTNPRHKLQGGRVGCQRWRKQDEVATRGTVCTQKRITDSLQTFTSTSSSIKTPQRTFSF